jgi:hypothetical protein
VTGDAVFLERIDAWGVVPEGVEANAAHERDLIRENIADGPQLAHVAVLRSAARWRRRAVVNWGS